LQGFLLQVEISEITVHAADEPNALVDFLDAELLAGQYQGKVDSLAVQAEATAGGDDDVVIVERDGIGVDGSRTAPSPAATAPPAGTTSNHPEFERRTCFCRGQHLPFEAYTHGGEPVGFAFSRHTRHCRPGLMSSPED